MSEDHIAVAINGVLYVKFEDAKKLREGWDKTDAEIEKLRAERRVMRGALMTIALHTEGAHPHRMSYMADLHRIARAALGEKE
jgi:hypothetical protein